MLNLNKDQELFDGIAENYAEKDFYKVTKTVRNFQIESLMKLIDNYGSDVKFNDIIEIGCGNGANSVYLRKYYSKYTGMDFSSELINIADKYYKNEKAFFFTGDIKDLGCGKKYDLIVGVGVLHHLPDLKEYLDHIFGLGDENSVFAFLEPQADNPAIQFLRFIRKKTDPAYSKTQVFFKRSDLSNAFSEAGLEVIKFQYTGYFTPPFAQVIMKPSWLFLPVVKSLILLDRFIQNKLPNRLAWNLSFIAKKTK